MTRYACDMKPMLKMMVGDNATKLDLDTPVDLKKLKFYYMDSDDNPFHTPVQQDIKDSVHKVIAHFTKMGCPTKKAYFKQFKYGFEIWLTAMNDSTTPKTAVHLTNMKGEVNPFKELLKCMISSSDYTACGLALCLSEMLATRIDNKLFDEMRKELTEELHDLLGKHMNPVILKSRILVFPLFVI